MMLARIEQGPRATFECPGCEQVQKMLLVEDPLKPANTGWRAGSLAKATKVALGFT